MSLQHARIAARAHDLWELRGKPDGSPETDWYAAEKQLDGDASDPSEPKAQQAADVLIADVDTAPLGPGSDDRRNGIETTSSDGAPSKRSRARRTAARQHRENGASRE